MEFLSHRRKYIFTVVCLFIATLLFNSITCYANDTPVTNYPPRVLTSLSIFDLLSSDNEALGDFQTITIPLKRTGRLFLIEARIDDQVGNLIFDTGASGLVLNRTYFRKYTGSEKSSGGGVTGSFDKIYRIVVKRIDISEMYYENVIADLADLGHIENRRGVKILGLFGLSMIHNFEVIFDAGKSELQLNRIDKQGNRLNSGKQEIKFDFTQKVETQHDIMLIKGKIGDKTLNFCLDTGAESNVISSDVSKKVMSTIQINRRSNLGGASAGSVEVLYGTMKELEFGNHQFGDMETVVTSLSSMSESYGCSIDGMLGYDFWQKGIFCINFGKNEISFSMAKGDKK
jgi:predicted aspartyl protease